MSFTAVYRIFIPLLIIYTTVLGQYQGRVVDGETGDPLTGVNITIAERENGFVTDEDGYFSINISLNPVDTVQFSYIGYQSREMTAGELARLREDIRLFSSMLRAEPIIVTGVRAEKRKNPVPFSTLTAAQIKTNYGAKDVPMLLAELPGVYSYSDNGSGVGYSYLKMRGFDSKRISVMINGIPHNDPEEHSVYWVDMPDLAESATSLQVQKGVGISPNAISSFGGSVNLMTTGIPTEFGPEVAFSYGSYNTQKYSANVNVKLRPGWYATFRLSKMQTDGYREKSGVDLWSYYFKLVRVGQKSFTQMNIYGGNEITHAAWDYSPESILKQNHRHNPVTYDNYVDNFKQPHYELIHRWEINPRFSWNNTLFYIHGQGYYEQLKNGRDLWEYGLFSVKDSVEADLVRRKWVYKDQLGAVSELNYTPTQTLNLALGFYGSTYRSAHNGNVLQLFNVTNGMPVMVPDNYQYYRFFYDKQYVNSYFNLEWQPNKKTTIQGSLYLQRIHFGFHHGNRGNFAGALRHAFKVDYTFFTPRVGINYNINRNLSAYASLSQSRREPSADDLFNGWDGPDDLGVAPLFKRHYTVYKNGQVDHIEWRNPQMQDEKMTDVELGLRYKNNRYSADLNVFRMNFKDEIVPLSQVDDNGFIINGNAEESIHEGFELNQVLKLNKAITIGNALSYSHNYFETFNQSVYLPDWSVGEADFSGNTIAGFPDWMSYSFVRIGDGNMSVKLGHRSVGRIFLDNTEDKERSIDPVSELFDLTMVVRIPSNWMKARDGRLIFKWNNLLGTKYYTAGYYDSWYGENYLLPAATGNFLMTARFNF